jgi:hypothetical protein
MTDHTAPLANGTRVEFTRSHIDANGVTTRETHTGTIVGTRAPHPTAPRPRRSYDVIEDGHPADSWEATHPLTFLEDDVTPVKALASMVMVIDWHRSGKTERHTGELRAMRELADRIANVRGGHIAWTFHSDSASGWLLPEGRQSYRDAIAEVAITLAEDERVFSESDSSTFDLAPADRYEWFLVDTADGELNLFRLSDMRNLNDPERLAVLCGYPGCDEPATASVTLPLPDHRRKDAAVCDTHEQGARFLADTLSEWVDEAPEREPAVSRLFPADSHDTGRACPTCGVDLEDSDAAVNAHLDSAHGDGDTQPAGEALAEWEQELLAQQDSETDTLVSSTGEHIATIDAHTGDVVPDSDAAELEASVARHPAGKRRRTMSAPAGETVRPWVGWQRRDVGLAGQISYTVTVQYPGERSMYVTFVGSTYGRPGVVTMVWKDSTGVERQEHVSAPERFGLVLDVDWIRAFYGYGEDSECGIMLADGSQHSMGIVTHCKREMIHGGNHSIYRV